MDLDFLANGRVTRRYHGLPMLDYQRVDSHSYGVAQLCRYLLQDYDDAGAHINVIYAALDHDLAEFRTGDIPGPSKRYLGIREPVQRWEEELMNEAGLAQPELNEVEARILKIADAAEGCLHTIEERRMGNAHPRIYDCFYAFWDYCMVEQLAAQDVGTAEGRLMRYIGHSWQRANGGKW